MEDIINCMQKDGVVVFNQKLPQQSVIQLKDEVNHIRKVVMERIKDMEHPLRLYSDIAERELNRLDYRCGFTANIFKEVEKTNH